MARQTTIPTKTVEEEIQSYNVIVGEGVIISVGRGETINNTFRFNNPQVYEQYMVDGEDFEYLLSANPVWAPTKPANVFRKDDLWSVIDAKRANTPLKNWKVV